MLGYFFHSLGPCILAFLCSMVTRYFWWRRWKFSDIFSYGTEENNERYVAFNTTTAPWSSFNIKLHSHLFLSVQPLSCAVKTVMAGQPVEFISLWVSILWWIKFQVYLESFLGPTQSHTYFSAKHKSEWELGMRLGPNQALTSYYIWESYLICFSFLFVFQLWIMVVWKVRKSFVQILC